MMSLQQFPFDDLAGAEVVATVPISDRLVNELIARDMPADAAVREVIVRAEPGNRLRARVTLRAGFVPSLNINAEIEQQPALPATPILGLRLSGLGGLLGFAGAAAGFANVLPPGVRMDGDRVYVNIHVLLQERGLGPLVPHLKDLFVTTEERKIVLALRLNI